MKFLHLVDKHFPRSNKLDKIFNGNTIKVSYSGQHGKNNQEPQQESNIQGMSYMHPCHPNATVVKRRHAHSTETAKQPALFTKPKSRQPQILKKKTYVGLREGTRKQRICIQIIINNRKYINSTTLSKHIWKLKDNNQAPEITWSIKTSAPAYTNITNRCMLCLQEKMAIITFPDEDSLLIRRSDLISKCRHENKFILRNYAGINLTGYHSPPGHPWAFAPKCVPSPRAFAQQKMPGGRANK